MARKKIEKEIASIKQLVVVGLVPTDIAIMKVYDLLVNFRKYPPDCIEEILDCKREAEKMFAINY